MNDRLLKLRIALDRATPDRLRTLARSALDAWADVDACKAREGGGYEVGFFTMQAGTWPAPAEAGTWVQVAEGSRDYCVGMAEGMQRDCDVGDYYRARAMSGFEVWPVWGRGVLGDEEDGEG